MFLTTDEQEEFRQAVRQMCEDKVAPHAAECDEQAKYPWHAHEAFSAMGLMGLTFPEDCGGSGADHVTWAICIEEIARVDAASSLIPAICDLAMTPVMRYGSKEVQQRFMRPICEGRAQASYCLSEAEAGSDVASMTTRAVRDGDEWVVNGQKVWTSLAHHARYALLLARTDPDQPKHKGLTYFVLDMHAPGVETRPLRQMTGQAEFNEVYMTDARIPDTHRLGAVGNGWRVAMTTLMNERSAIGGSSSVRGAGAIADAVELWARYPERHTPVLRDKLAALWTRAEAQRLTDERARRSATSGSPGPEGSIAKLVSAELNQHVYEFCMELLGPEATLYGDYTQRDVRRSDVRFAGAPLGSDARSAAAPSDYRGPVQQRFLRSRANTIEGGTSEVLRNILGERILGLPGDLRADAGKPWKEVPRG
jgi:alkylation response protein AidB-like acyl-CoA dehydrogenase